MLTSSPKFRRLPWRRLRGKINGHPTEPGKYACPLRRPAISQCRSDQSSSIGRWEVFSISNTLGPGPERVNGQAAVVFHLAGKRLGYVCGTSGATEGGF